MIAGGYINLSTLRRGMHIYIRTFGCAHNQADSEMMAGLLEEAGHELVESPEKAEQYKPHMKYMFDEILQRGTNSDGIIVRNLQEAAGHFAVRPNPTSQCPRQAPK